MFDKLKNIVYTYAVLVIVKRKLKKIQKREVK